MVFSSRLVAQRLVRFNAIGIGHRAWRRNLNTLRRPVTLGTQRGFEASIRAPAQRSFVLDSVPTFLLPPVAFIGLFISLWIYKCMMMILFQDKIIYMPYVPPFSRSEKVEDYADRCKPVGWKTMHIRSLDRTKITLCIGQIPSPATALADKTLRQVIICYFQGNGSSLPPRLPVLSNVLKQIEAEQRDETAIAYTMVALSYRGYWTSSGRASQAGIELDALALLQWVGKEFDANDLEIILWGQSIGAGVASVSAAAYGLQGEGQRHAHISGLILETPFSNIRSMLSAIYPQKWLPYGYLWPFLWNHWDSEQALRRISRQATKPKVLLLPATKDEIVPPREVDKLEELCHEVGLHVQRVDIPGALHTEATSKRKGQQVVADFVLDVAARRVIESETSSN